MLDRARAKEINQILADTPVRYLPDTWTGPLIIERLVETFRTLDRLPGNVGPKRVSNTFGPFAASFYTELDADPKDAEARVRLKWARGGPTPQEISRMDRALEWPMKYLGADENASRALLAYVVCKSRHRDVRRLPSLLGLSAADFDNHRRRGAFTLAVALTKDSVPVG